MKTENEMRETNETEMINNFGFVLESFRINRGFRETNGHLSAARSRMLEKELNRNDGFKTYTVATKPRTDSEIIRFPIRAKFRWSNNPSGAVCHCIVWIESVGVAYGKAGGYGYCKESSALDDALESVGINFKSLHGTGRTREALEMLAMALGHKWITIDCQSF